MLEYRDVMCLMSIFSLIRANSCWGHSSKKCCVLSSSYSQYGQLGSAHCDKDCWNLDRFCLNEAYVEPAHIAVLYTFSRQSWVKHISEALIITPLFFPFSAYACFDYWIDLQWILLKVHDAIWRLFRLNVSEFVSCDVTMQWTPINMQCYA